MNSWEKLWFFAYVKMPFEGSGHRCAGRNLVRQIDLYARNNSYALPRLVRGIEVQKYLQALSLSLAISS